MAHIQRTKGERGQMLFTQMMKATQTNVEPEENPFRTKGKLASIALHSNGKHTANDLAQMGWRRKQNQNVHKLINAHMAKASRTHGNGFTLKW